MGLMDKMAADKAKHVPESGYNLVGLDDFEDPGEQLYLIGNFPSKEEAQAEMKKRESSKDHNGDRMFIYGPGDR